MKDARNMRRGILRHAPRDAACLEVRKETWAQRTTWMENLRKNVLRHERRHIMNVRKRGMTKKAGRVNALIEHEYQWALWAMVGGLVVAVHFQNMPIFFFALIASWLVNRWYWHWRCPRPQQTFK